MIERLKIVAEGTVTVSVLSLFMTERLKIVAEGTVTVSVFWIHLAWLNIAGPTVF